MWRALIVDDERLARVALRGLLEDRSDVQVVGEAESVASALAQLVELKPDVVFLDVQMPGGSGFELFNRGLDVKVVFCTAYERYALRAFEVNALDYLLKPIDPAHIDRALKRLAAPSGESASSAALKLDDLVSLKEASTTRFAAVRDITFIQAADDYSEVHLIDAKSALVDVTLRVWEARLPPADFVRIHRSSLVNLHHVEAIESADGQGHVLLRGQTEPLVISRRMGRELRTRLGR